MVAVYSLRLRRRTEVGVADAVQAADFARSSIQAAKRSRASGGGAGALGGGISLFRTRRLMRFHSSRFGACSTERSADKFRPAAAESP